MKSHLNYNLKRIPKVPQIMEVGKILNELKKFKISNYEKIQNTVDRVHMESLAWVQEGITWMPILLYVP
ncbi:hypothetical protein GCM10023330_04570 [Litoribaculum gwangyangense]|uniref:Uncharacterized protein n=1 Tax=Litoribaculum gwangyangense TaxID=1130722 RepID=A0ABP9BX41_9FLAO